MTFWKVEFLYFIATYCMVDTAYSPTWSSLDSRPLPQWYDDAKFGIFIHWGVFSVPSFGSEWFWKYLQDKNPEFVSFMRRGYKPEFTYQEFAKDFTAEFYNASEWVDLFEASGARYVVLTSKHHEGYTLWPSKYSFGWNAKDIGPHRDLIGELHTAIQNSTSLRFGLYYSLFEWFNPLWKYDKENLFATNLFVTNKVNPELHEIVETYKPAILWSDGDAEAPDTYWQSKEFLVWLYNESPVKESVVTNDRWGIGTACKHGGYYTCTDRYNPDTLQEHKWENCMTIDRKSWGYRRNADLKDYLSLDELIKELVISVSRGGNLLMNVGPSKDGTIAPIFEERLRGIGQWLKANGEAIYKSKPWKVQNDTLSEGVWYTVGENDNNLYAIVLSWPSDDILKLKSVKLHQLSRVEMLDSNEEISWIQLLRHLRIKLPVAAHVGRTAWVLKMDKYDLNL
ncbi:PREDICTED: alpha-L-fucosidase-like [Ceratosolen solmsi marchali]|uniref:Putative alpha-L-fucosidase n=1 Tax=Ceratosolen solmsi marchali TaxID=326594 RepID=A0AAJ6YHQ5_9HYME|nr:PREDICTED: alpha-L-fucosidase-like [Ceratosolen solmsi marchali]